jgi:hypothetical protein
MKKCILTGLLFLLCPRFAAGSTISYSQEVGQAYSGKKFSNTLSVPFTPTNNPVPVGDTVLLQISIKGNTPISSVTDSVGNIYRFRGGIDQGRGLRAETWTAAVTGQMIYGQGSITITDGGSVQLVAVAEDYSGVAEIGSVTTSSGTGTQPTVTLATQDNGDWVVASFGWSGPSTTVVETGWACIAPPGCTDPVCCTESIRTSPAGILRDADMTTGSGTEVGVADNDNSFSTPSNVTNTIQLSASAPWAAVAVELRAI